MPNKKVKITVYSACVYLCFSIITALFFYNDFLKKKTVAIEQIKKESTRQLAYSHHEFNELTNRIANTLDLVSKSRPLYDYFLYPSSRVQQAVESSWLRLMQVEKFFSTLELVNENGDSLFSFTYDVDTGKTIKQITGEQAVNDLHLKTLTQLPEGRIFSEGVILNHKLASSGIYKPMMQISIPIDISGVRKGYVLAELSDSSIVNVVRFSPTLSISPSIVNQDGYYLLSDKPEEIFGHLVNGREDKTLKEEKPELWNIMSEVQVGSTYLNGSIYSFYRFSIDKRYPNKGAYFLLSYPEKALEKSFYYLKVEVVEEAAIVFLLLGLIVIPLGILLTSWDRSNLDSQLAKSALEGMSAVVITDKHQRIIKVNTAFTSISGFTSDDSIGKSTFDVLVSHCEQSQKRLNNWKQVEELGAWQGEIDVLGKNQEELSLLVRIQSVMNKRNEVQYYIISYIDITQRKILEKELRYLSEKDSLSDCWNRRKFEFELENQMLLTNRYNPVHQCCLAILDIDWFKRINDTLGHEIGDEVIRLVARVLKDGSRETDFVARIGGEEFAIIMPHTELKDADMVINRLRIAVSRLDEYQVTISGGLTDINLSRENAYKCADLALYESKANGRNKVSVCTSVADLA
ncbi:diguanylate cyclase [Aliivibrio finisterrensis]|uniref:diguanylate cyclase n=1 Tax=Aliivibrio finisterrensis TaxID=511998 RepID=A0A4Q5KKF7_9GAMM|nr:MULTISPECIES: sensor domain-containing diguanylate cyclase [Aliivibrio]MDD9175686.1 sensor domain-containing diguanylate cyclase [Aliivibrio sp. S3TY1]MDD9192740.1 sensor domain-containing diguanylate cyclase [Aliivibrio sp. S2TY2]RYU45725.1 diguanylate cyclase [Aliivibrio finisterrensis]RYU69971.1 diguanylate cyclase [Aliivibrio finisterrensis]RYU73760.1 diguanylate cyclase [Aliivibrio finisterrensis]